MSIVCIIVAFGNYDLVEKAARSALKSGAEEVYIWDNSPSSEYPHRNLDMEHVQVLGDGTNWGFGGGVNRAFTAIGETRHTFLLLNPDAELSADALRLLADDLGRTPGIVAPRMRYPNGDFGIAGGPRPTALKELLASTRIDDFLPGKLRRALLLLFRGTASGSLGDSLSPGPSVSMYWVSGFCMLIDGETLMTLGGFDEDFFLYFEDIDLCRRARTAGFSVRLVRDAIVLHDESASTKTAGKSSHYHEGRRRYFAKHHGWVANRLILLANRRGSQ